MQNSDKKQFLEIMNGMAAVMKTELTTPMVKIYWEVLSDCSIAEVSAACNAYVRKGKFFPAPAELLELIPSMQSAVHVGADEAWAIVVESMDERATVVMTKEMQEARAVAWPLWEAGDDVGSRMAFREAYNRIIKAAAAPQWSVSLGFDIDGRVAAINKAVDLGRLTHEEAQRFLPVPRDGGPIAGLLTGKVAEMPNNIPLERWSVLKQALLDGQKRLEEQERQDREQKRLDFEAKRKQVLDAVEERLRDTVKA